MPAQTVIKIRRGTATAWGSVVLAEGEIGYDTTNKKFKIGDGTLGWSALPDTEMSWADITDKPTSFTPSTHASTHTDGGGDEITIAASQITPGTTGQVLTTDGTTTSWGSAGSSLPSQTGNAGELLVTDGTNTSWSNTVTANTNTTPALIVKGLLNQSGTLQRWVNSDNNTLISFSGTNTAGMEIGRTDGTASTPFIDFHSGATATDHDSRIVASGGNGTNAAGSLEFQAASVTFSGTITANPAEPDINQNSAKRVGYVGLPQASTSSAITASATWKNYAGEHIYTTTTGLTHTLPANSSQALEIGTTIVFINPASVTTTIAVNTDALILAGVGPKTPSGGVSTVSLAPHGMATLVKITTTSWIASGNGLT